MVGHRPFIQAPKTRSYYWYQNSLVPPRISPSPNPLIEPPQMLLRSTVEVGGHTTSKLAWTLDVSVGQSDFGASTSLPDVNLNHDHGGERRSTSGMNVDAPCGDVFRIFFRFAIAFLLFGFSIVGNLS